LSIFAAALTTSAAAADGFPLKKLASFTFLVDYEPFWSPDSRQIVVVSNRHGGMKLHVMNADSTSHGSDMRQLTFGNDEDDTPAWSPDGKKIAFVSIRNGVSQIFVMNADGTNIRQLTSGNAETFIQHGRRTVPGFCLTQRSLPARLRRTVVMCRATTKSSVSKSIRRWTWRPSELTAAS
jgi:dipeptidyl aminopeptidase/acylaminoacyl peptidase